MEEVIKKHIEKQKEKRVNTLSLLNKINNLNDTVGLSEETYKEINIKIGSELAKIDSSIKQHQNLLKSKKIPEYKPKTLAELKESYPDAKMHVVSGYGKVLEYIVGGKIVYTRCV